MTYSSMLYLVVPWSEMDISDSGFLAVTTQTWRAPKPRTQVSNVKYSLNLLKDLNPSLHCFFSCALSIIYLTRVLFLRCTCVDSSTLHSTSSTLRRTPAAPWPVRTRDDGR